MTTVLHRTAPTAADAAAQTAIDAAVDGTTLAYAALVTTDGYRLRDAGLRLDDACRSRIAAVATGVAHTAQGFGAKAGLGRVLWVYSETEAAEAGTGGAMLFGVGADDTTPLVFACTAPGSESSRAQAAVLDLVDHPAVVAVGHELARADSAAGSAAPPRAPERLPVRPKTPSRG